MLPAEVTLDTSFIVNALIEGEPHHDSARAFMEQLAEARTTLAFNTLLELELREIAFRIPLVERFSGDLEEKTPRRPVTAPGPPTRPADDDFVVGSTLRLFLPRSRG